MASIHQGKSGSEKSGSGLAFCLTSGGYSMKEIGDYFSLHYSRASHISEKGTIYL